ncbi:MAG: acetyl-CoA carboxylase biotin carboxylase subunit [Chloroherpetonaceae bacterium]|nr:acetyl-CoA carboxylase biotin carboxylase subunit [Chthonomonadaceae bacterium]MDW8209298.1 acetyl-CoA carboxylase biotin carboxylase subunit [Chloroherpetonaceae bacterium]
MKRLLIANRGEIAVRIIRACREMGISPVAVYSEADARALHVSLADAAVCIGGAPARASYLNVEGILEAGQRLGADAIHPGYGFLSENAAFAQACVDAGFVFVGPPASVIRTLGDKIAAKRLMASAGVPVVPGYAGEAQDGETLCAEAARVGYPVLIKAAAGGGGRGMRVARDAREFPGALEEARREAVAAFGDGRVFLERYVAAPRHVEFQIFGDAQGNVVHLFERECSIQRRHQKLLEESPSPVLTPELRARMAEAAVTAGRAAGYVNAGTVEFLVEVGPGGDVSFYFLEVNTRLQVEHPVTEMLTGVDLVRWQLEVACGRPLPAVQAEIQPQGHVMEVRIYAEDAAQGFLPSVGVLQEWRLPEGPGVRVDSGVERGDEVSPYYDPMLAKLIVQGRTRMEALARMERALEQFSVAGVQTIVPYLLAIVRHPDFRRGATTTRFLSEHFAGWRPDSAVPEEVLVALAAEALLSEAPAAGARMAVRGGRGHFPDPWRVASGWRNV